MRSPMLLRRSAASVALPAWLAAAALFGPGTAQAQVDPNIESRIETLAPPIPDIRPAPPETRRIIDRRHTDAELKVLLARRNDVRLAVIDTKEGRESEAARLGLLFKMKDVTTRPLKYQFQIPIGGNFDSNAFRTQSNHRSDFVFTPAVALSAAVPIGEKRDQLALSASANPIRYAQFPTRDVDIIKASAAYQMFKERRFDDRYKESEGMLSLERLDVQVANSTSFAPTFRRETSLLVTPSVGWQMANIPLSKELYTKTPKEETFLHYADVFVRVGYTLSDVATLENVNVNVLGKVGWRFPKSGVTLSASGTATGRSYSHITGGREDLLLGVGPRFDYRYSSNFLIGTDVIYYRQFSTVPTSRFDAVVVSGILTFQFSWQQQASGP